METKAYRIQTLASLTGNTEWPTPHGFSPDGGRSNGPSEDSEQTGGHRGRADTLTSAARLWPTPKGSAAGPDFAKVTRSSTGISLQTAVQMWPTPTEGDAKSSGSRNTATSKAHPGISLTDAVRGDSGTGRMPFATPTAAIAEGRAPQNSKGKRDLRLDASTWATPTSRDHKTGQLPTRDGGDSLPVQAGGSLNPMWVEWLQGFPLGWTEVE